MRRMAAIVLLIVWAEACVSSQCAEGYRVEDLECTPIDAGSDGSGPMAECDPPCGVHETCDDTDSPAICRCASGYTGDPCVLAELPLDPGFEAIEGSPWTASRGATVTPLAKGLEDGVVFFDASVICNAGQVSQVIDMPGFDSAGPLVAEVIYRNPGGELGGSGLDIGVGASWKTLLPTDGDDWATSRVCLGEGAYGGVVEVRAGPSEPRNACLVHPTGAMGVDRLEIKSAESNECPEPGTVKNGTADLENGGWVFQEQVFYGDGLGEASLVGEVGQTGSGARLHRPPGPGLDSLAMATMLSVPLASSLPSPAVRFWWKASDSPGSGFSMDIGTFGYDRRLGNLFGDGESHQATYCLPPWTQGSVIDLAFALESAEDPAELIELIVDDVEIVSEPSCGDAPELFDPDFDSTIHGWPGVVPVNPDLPMGVREDPEFAPSGRGVFEFTYAGNWERPYIETWVRVPSPDGGNGPGLEFSYHLPNDPQTPVRWFLGGAGDFRGDLIDGGDWLDDVVCLPAAWSGRWFRVQFQLGPGTPFVAIDPPKHVFLDDFRLTTSVDCPVE